MAGYGGHAFPYKVGDSVTYVSTSLGQDVPTEVSAVHADGTIEVACKKGAKINARSENLKWPSGFFGASDMLSHAKAANFQVGDSVEYFSTTVKAWIPTKITNVNPDGTVEIECKPGAKIDAKSKTLQQPTQTVSLADAKLLLVSKYKVGDQVEYFSGSYGKWIDCKVIEVNDNDEVQIDVKAGQWLSHSSIRAKDTHCAGDPQDAAPEEEISAASWELVKKEGFLGGPMEDKVDSPEKAKEMVLADPSTYMGYSVAKGTTMTWVRKQGAGLTAVPNFESYLLSCKAIQYAGTPFTDSFVSNRDMFVGGLENGKQQGHTASWRRPGRGEGLLDREGLRLFGSIHPNDLKQGAVGDCSLIASIACLCEFPVLIKRLFKRSQISPSGRYDITLFDWGKNEWVTRAIDDRLATKSKDDPNPMFVQASIEYEIFPCLLEKAVAIMAGGFDYMSSIMPTWALGVLTGCTDVWSFSANNGQWTGSRPVYDGSSTFQAARNIREGAWPDGSDGHTPKSNAEMLAYMRQWDEQDMLVCAGSAAQGKSDSSSLPCGIIYMHAYSVLEVKTNIAGTGINLLKCRNPHGWGGQEPDLPWKDNAPEWKQYPQITKECFRTEDDTHAADGLFWIRDTDFFGPNSTHFNTVYLVKFNMSEFRRKDPKHGMPKV